MKGIKTKKDGAFVLALLLLLSQVVPAFAAETDDSDAEYELAVAAIMRDYWNDPEGTVNRLTELDTELVGEPTVEVHYAETENAARGTSPSDYILTVYAFKRGNTSNYRLQWALECERTEILPGALDFVSIEWDTAHATYYSSSGDSTYSTVRGRSTGIVLFNLEDDKLKAGDSAIGTVQVTPIVAGTMEYGAKFTHTYAETEGVSTASTRFVTSSYQSYTYTYNVTTNENTSYWSLWQDNAVTMHL